MDNKVFMENKVYNQKSINKFWFYFITFTLSLLVAVFYYFFDRIFKYSQILGQAIILTAAVITLGQFYIVKERFIDKFGKENAYRRAFYMFHVTAMPLIYVSAIHPLFSYSEKQPIINLYLRIILSAYFIISSVLLHRRTINIFGVDNLFMYYVYFPEESVKTESIIYLILRHPVYSAMARMAFGLGVLRGTPESLIVGLLLPVSQFFWLRFFEEKELTERFADSYEDYIKNVWAIIVKPSKLKKFWMFLMGAKRS